MPVYFEGIRQVMPKGSALSNGGTIYIEVGRRLTRDSLDSIGDALAQSKEIRRRHRRELARIYSSLSTAANVRPIVMDRYIYKGSDVERHARRALRAFVAQADALKTAGDATDIVVADRDGQGELALMLALMYPGKNICCRLGIAENRELLRGCIEDFVHNVTVSDYCDTIQQADGANRTAIFRVLAKGEVFHEEASSGITTIKSYL